MLCRSTASDDPLALVEAEIKEPAARAAMYRIHRRGTGEVVPGFGGMFVDRQDNSIFYVYLLEPDQETAERSVQKALEILGPPGS